MPNLLAVLVVAIISMIIGALWYSPLLFGNIWMKLMKITKADIEKAKKKSMTGNYVASFIAVLILSYVLSFVIGFVAFNSIGGSILLSLLLWLGFIATTFLNSVLWENKSVKLYLINILHYLVVFLVAAIIFSIWV